MKLFAKLGELKELPPDSNEVQAAVKKLFDMGYTHIYEFGGIIDWSGEIVTE